MPILPCDLKVMSLRYHVAYKVVVDPLGVVSMEASPEVEEGVAYVEG
jgi:hypothetical protein